jgi:hypothetical protein
MGEKERFWAENKSKLRVKMIYLSAREFAECIAGLIR